MRGCHHRVQSEQGQSPGLRGITEIPRKSPDALAEAANSPVIDELRHEHRLATAFATHLADTYGGMRARRNVKIGTLARWQERRAKEMLAANLTGGITLADLAMACELSIRHFTRAFRGSTGMSPHRWLLQLRIEKAKCLLANSRGLLADIALDCGFADQSHFTRAFQRTVGSSPGAWQRLHRR